MHFNNLLTLSTLAVLATAQQTTPAHNNATASAQNLASVVAVLQTALPSSLLAEAITNQAAVSSEIASEFAAGKTPAWFTALPTAVQNYLVPAATYPNATGSLVSSATHAANATGNLTTSSTSRRVSSVTTVTSTSTASESGSGDSASATDSGSSSSSSGGAAMPTALVGMGLAGAVGVLGLVVL